MNRIQTMLLALFLAPAISWAQDTVEDQGASEPNEVVVSVNEVPERVLATARAAKPGAYITDVLRQLRRDDEYYYRLYASQVGRYWVIEVREDGELMRAFEAPSAPGSLTGS